MVIKMTMDLSFTDLKMTDIQNFNNDGDKNDHIYTFSLKKDPHSNLHQIIVTKLTPMVFCMISKQKTIHLTKR